MSPRSLDRGVGRASGHEKPAVAKVGRRVFRVVS